MTILTWKEWKGKKDRHHRPVEPITLAPGEIHAWQVTQDESESRFKRYWEFLDTEERIRADRFRKWESRLQFVACRGILRTLLGLYLGEDPGTIEFSYGPQGKPTLADQQAAPSLQFNLSHSGDLAILAFAAEGEIGVDLEKANTVKEYLQIASRFFSHREVERLRSMTMEQQPREFLKYWVRKEAYVKARGLGASLALDRFAVAYEDPPCPALFAADYEPEELNRWVLVPLPHTIGYVSALVVAQQDYRLSCWRYSD